MSSQQLNKNLNALVGKDKALLKVFFVPKQNFNPLHEVMSSAKNYQLYDVKCVYFHESKLKYTDKVVILGASNLFV